MNLDQTFTTEYKRLNPAQKKAVDQTTGPVMVVAGPGTGKTQLLAMRVANILKTTDASASNILCLTFTDNASANMIERIASIIGPDAYKVAVHTFHSFGREIMDRAPEYFYRGAEFRPADELASSEVIERILSELPYDNPLSSTMNGQFTYLRPLAKMISDLKKSGLSPDELRQCLNQNLQFLDFVEPLLLPILTQTSNMKLLAPLSDVLASIEDYDAKKLPFMTEPPLSEIFAGSLRIALEEAVQTNKPQAITKWKKDFSKPDKNKRRVLNDRLTSEKMLAVADIYDLYLLAMAHEELYDFDDMILTVTQALDAFPELKLDLQEQFQYVLVDEFQDTNDAQMRILRALTDYDAQPNIMVVGDDDQAIYRFQGADISNIQSFSKTYDNVETIVLTENYRSVEQILDVASKVITQAEERLSHLENLEKNLTAHVSSHASGTEISYETATTATEECAHIAEKIASRIADGKQPQEIAVIARRHTDLIALIPYLNTRNIAVRYDKQTDILASEPVVQLELLARIADAISRADHDLSAQLLPQLLAHPAWEIPPRDIWELSISASKQHKYWLEVMLAGEGRLRDIAEWLVIQSAYALNKPLEQTLDELFGRETVQLGNDEHDDITHLESATVPQVVNGQPGDPFAEDTLSTFASPLKEYFFDGKRLVHDPEEYLGFLASLRTIRSKAREYHTRQDLRLHDFIEMIDAYRDLSGGQLTATREFGDANRVQLLTAHGAKGLEFDTVFIMNASSKSWGSKSRGRGAMLGFPHNMPFSMSGDSDDERIRLLFVALTRARRELIISRHTADDTGKEVLGVEYLLSTDLQETAAPESTQAEKITNEETAWFAPLVTGDETLKKLLGPTLAAYRISATHLNNFVNVVDGGPESFLMQNLLRFPQSKHPSAAFGTAIHGTLQRAHIFMNTNKQMKPTEDILRDFEILLTDERLNERDHEYYLKKGIDALDVFLTQKAADFTPGQMVERKFSDENIMVGDARLSGAIDVMDIDAKTKTIRVKDYKTGAPARSWRGDGDYEKIKLHKHRQQLIFYKLLVEHSRAYAGYRVMEGVLQYVEPTTDGEILELAMEFDDKEVQEFKDLLASVWQHIMNVNLPDIGRYEANVKGILAFEDFLRTK